MAFHRGLAENLAEKDGKRVPNRAGDCRLPIRKNLKKRDKNAILSTFSHIPIELRGLKGQFITDIYF
jgi:hypothetical protein